MPETKLSQQIRRWWQRGGVWSWIIVVAFVGVDAYFVTLSLFAASELGHQAAISQEGDRNAPGYELVLTGIDHVSRQIAFDISSNQPVGKQSIVRCFLFIYSFSDARGTVQLGRPTLVTLKEIARETLPADQQWSETHTKYQGSGEFAFETDLRKFPFDAIHFKVRSQCSVPNAQIDQTPTGELTIKNRVRDYHLTQRQTYLVLTRNSFLKMLAVVLLVIGFVGSIALIVQARTQWPTITLLTYFAGLWATRDILQKPIEGAKAFPSVIEVTVLFLFSFTIIGMLALRYFGSGRLLDARRK